MGERVYDGKLPVTRTGEQMKEPEYIDEKLANARRMYMEDRINQMEGKGVWKGKIYDMIPYMVTQMGLFVEVPDFLYRGRKENLPAAGNMNCPFCVMLSEDRDISCTFYSGAGSKVYRPDEMHQLFMRLYPGIQLSPLYYDGTDKELCHFCFLNKWNSSQLYHTIFLLNTGKLQIFGHLNGEAGEQEALEHIQRKILQSIERSDADERVKD